MLTQSVIDDLKQYLALHYRPEGAKIRAFDQENESSHNNAAPIGALVASVISSDFFKGLERLVSKLDMTFSEKLMWWIEKKGRKPADVNGKVGITKSHFAKIRNNIKYHPTKETALAFVVALHLTLEEAADLLKRAGDILSESCLGDMIVAYFLEAGRYDIDEVNDALDKYGCKVLTNWRKSK